MDRCADIVAGLRHQLAFFHQVAHAHHGFGAQADMLVQWQRQPIRYRQSAHGLSG